MDIAMIFDHLVPGADWRGSVTASTRKAFDAVRWGDSRPKPSWEEMETAWPEVEAKIIALENAPTLEERLTARLEKLENDVEVLKGE